MTEMKTAHVQAIGGLVAIVIAWLLYSLIDQIRDERRITTKLKVEMARIEARVERIERELGFK